MSITLSELVDYNGCDEACASALDLLKDSAHDATAKQKIYARQAPARLPAKRTREAEAAVGMLVGSPEKSIVAALSRALS